MRLNKITAALVTGLASLAMAPAALAETIGAPDPWQMVFQPSATEIMDQTLGFHNGFLFPLTIGIAVFVVVLMAFVLIKFRAGANPEPNRFSHNTMIEVIWTLIPTVIVATIAIMSVKHIQFQDTPPAEAEVTIKAIGHQWYWEYEYVDHDIVFDSYIIRDEADLDGDPMLLATDTNIVLPVDTIISLLVTSSPDDVIHAWTIPAFGVKVDAIPGRLNERWFRVKPGFEGRYHGQCSELCGPDHAYMPITVDVVSKEQYEAWIASGGEAASIAPKTSDVSVALNSNSAN